MNKLDLEQIKADREAGTQGDWHVVEDWHGEDVQGYNINNPCVEIVGCEGLLGCKGIDARRIARVPDLEAALVEAVELLQLLQEHVSDLSHGDHVDAFLERFK